MIRTYGFAWRSDFNSEYVAAEGSVDGASKQKRTIDSPLRVHVCGFCLWKRRSSQPEDKRMKRITVAAVVTALAGLTISAGAAPAKSHSAPAFQQSCTAAPAVARAYLSAQVSAGKKLTMSRAAAIAEITKLTGTDGEFAGLKPCDAGYPNAVRFYLDEVIKAGTNNSTP